MDMIEKFKNYSSELNVMYIEDNEIIRNETSDILRLFFKNVETAENGKKGIEKYENNLFDLVITDMNMPIMNGIDMIKKIKKIHPKQNIVAVSAHNEPEWLANITQAGVNTVLYKPYEVVDIITALTPLCHNVYTQKINIY